MLAHPEVFYHMTLPPPKLTTKQMVSKITVQAFLAGTVTLVASAGFLFGLLDGATYIPLAILAFGWAFQSRKGK